MISKLSIGFDSPNINFSVNQFSSSLSVSIKMASLQNPMKVVLDVPLEYATRSALFCSGYLKTNILLNFL